MVRPWKRSRNLLDKPKAGMIRFFGAGMVHLWTISTSFSHASLFVFYLIFVFVYHGVLLVHTL